MPFGARFGGGPFDIGGPNCCPEFGGGPLMGGGLKLFPGGPPCPCMKFGGGNGGIGPAKTHITPSETQTRKKGERTTVRGPAGRTHHVRRRERRHARWAPSAKSTGTGEWWRHAPEAAAKRWRATKCAGWRGEVEAAGRWTASVFVGGRDLVDNVLSLVMAQTWRRTGG